MTPHFAPLCSIIYHSVNNNPWNFSEIFGMTWANFVVSGACMGIKGALIWGTRRAASQSGENFPAGLGGVVGRDTTSNSTLHRHACRHTKAIRRHARRRPKGWLRLSRHQRHQPADPQRRLAGVRRVEIRRHHPGLDRRRPVRLGHRGERHGPRGDRPGRSLPPARRTLRRAGRPAHRPLPAGQGRFASSSRSSRKPPAAARPAWATCSTPTCWTPRPCR